jgi:hypothetical protein
VEGQWWWAVIMLVGGLLAGGYVFTVLGRALSVSAPLKLSAPISRSRELLVLMVALCAILLGFVPLQPSEFLQIGRSETLTATSR